MRLIDADALSRKITEEYHGSYSEVQLAPYEVDAMIEAQPTVSQWIPCSKRLPDETCDGDELIATVNGHRNNVKYINAVVSDMVFEEGKWYLREVVVSDELEVLAWQPLPEPYREDE